MLIEDVCVSCMVGLRSNPVFVKGSISGVDIGNDFANYTAGVMGVA